MDNRASTFGPLLQGRVTGGTVSAQRRRRRLMYTGIIIRARSIFVTLGPLVAIALTLAAGRRWS